MAKGNSLPSDMYRDASGECIPSSSATEEQIPEASGRKRSAAEPLERSTTKITKLTATTDEDYWEMVQMELDAKDEQNSQLRSTLEKQKLEIARLEKGLEEAEDERDKYNSRMHVLQARELKRVEQERTVETSEHAKMKLASKNLHAQAKADRQRKEKEIEEDYREKLANQKEKSNAKWEKQWKEAQAKYQKAVADHRHEVKTLKDNHKEELKNIKESHKADIKSLKPEHNQVLKEKTSELKAKEKDIAKLEKSVQSMGALVAEKETLATQVEEEKAENEKLRKTFKMFQQAHEEVQGQYISKLEHEGRKWQIQHDQVELGKTQLISQQRSIFALRGELSYKTQKIQALERQLQNIQPENAVSTTDESVQTSIDTNNTTATDAGEGNLKTLDS